MTYRVWRGRLSYAAAIATLLAVWQVAAWMLPPYLLPGIPATLARLVQVVKEGELLSSLQLSLIRFGIGYPLACGLGALLGLLAGLNRAFATYLQVMITIASFFPMALAVMNATEGISRTHLELARVMGAFRWPLATQGRCLVSPFATPETSRICPGSSLAS